MVLRLRRACTALLCMAALGLAAGERQGEGCLNL